jgi:hypothetical protein
MTTKMRISPAATAAGLAGLAILATAAGARAANPACTDAVNHPNPVFISGSTAAQSAFQALANSLGNSISIIYQNPDSCFGVTDYLMGQASTEASVKNLFLDPVSGKGLACDLNATTPEVPDIAASDVFPETCVAYANSPAITTANQYHVLGPIQAMTIAVPQGSMATSISAEAAAFVFGCDAATGGTGACSSPSAIVSPWTVPGAIFTRPFSSGTLNMVAAAINLKPALWGHAQAGDTSGQQKPSTGGIFTALATETGAGINAGVSILSAEGVISNNAAATVDGGTGQTVKPLFFQGIGQTCGYLPDSTATSFDKLNVREGRYDIFGPVHFIVNKDATSGLVTGPHAAAATTVLNYIIATGPTPTQFLPQGGDAGAFVITTPQKQALIDAESKPTVGGVVPWCAMHVLRSAEIGAEASYQPPEPCGCHFEVITTGATVSPYCKACPVGTECQGTPYPVCRYGYCEVK